MRNVITMHLFFLVHSEANTRRIRVVEQCFGSNGVVSFFLCLCTLLYHLCQQGLVKPGRVLVGEGVLTKLCRKKAKPRQFFLFNDVLVYGNIVLDKKKVQLCCSFLENKFNTCFNISTISSILHHWRM